MALASCRSCKKLFEKVRKSICPACEAAEEVHYETVRAFLAENPGVNAERVAEGTAVPIETVLRFIQEGRVEAFGIGSTIPCGQCGEPAISPTKRLCKSCLGKLEAQIQQQQSRIKLPEKRDVDVGKALNTFRVPLKGGGLPGTSAS
ncbi:MAG: hypothetical protein HUU46_18890 [Candidatus Hydrogenedentes bacterium]|nr:hypothetical protein [Candidatus Hydrogenedentota bacterium]